MVGSIKILKFDKLCYSSIQVVPINDLSFYILTVPSFYEKI